MNGNLTDVTFVLDVSGSMGVIRNDTIGGINSYIESQKKEPGDMNFSLYLFDHEFDHKLNAVPIKSVNAFTENDYVPRGATALLDALGRAINETGERLAAMPETDRPGKVLFVILTDGEENSSKKFFHSQIADMIKHQREVYSWEFVYLGANQDAFAVAKSYNIPVANSSCYNYNSEGTTRAFTVCNDSTTSFRHNGNAKVTN